MQQQYTILGVIASMKNQYEAANGSAPQHLYVSEDIYDAIESEFTASSQTVLGDDARIVQVLGMFLHSSPFHPWHKFILAEFAL